jgi:hypothetical protein
MSLPEVCALCGNKAELRNSHILPAFFADYLKKTSATGYLRGAVSPNLRVQDLSKEKLLCDACEQRFSTWERKFAEAAFNVIQKDGFQELAYGEYLLPFLVSVSWRILVRDRASLVLDCPQFSRVIDQTLHNWRQFLLGQRKQPGSEHHLFILGIPEELPEDSHEKSLYYLLRAIDGTPGFGERTLFVYSKCLRSLIFSPLVPASPSGWSNTRVHASGGRLISPQKIAMAGFLEFLNSRIDMTFAESLSGKQKSKIAQTMLRAADKALQSESYKIHLASKRLIPRKTEKE